MWNRKRKTARWLLCACLWSIAARGAFAQVEHGTIIVLGYSTDRVFVVADSRATHSSGKVDDQQCKIVALDHRLLFAATGISVFNSYTPLIESWTATGEARKVFEGGNSNGLDNFTAYWAKGILGHLTEQIQFGSQELFDRVANNGPMLVDGVFAGINGDGNLAVRVVEASCEDTVQTPCSTDKIKQRTAVPSLKMLPLKPTANIQLEAFGMTETFREFDKPRKNFSPAESKMWVSIRGRKSVKDPDIRRAMKFVDMTVAYDPKKELVGGDIDAVELMRNGQVKWISRKANCPVD